MEKQKKIRYDTLTHAVCILFLVYTILRTYELFGIRMSDLADYLLIFVYLIRCGLNKKALPRRLNVYFVFWIVSIVVSSVWSGLNGLRPILGVVHSYLFYVLLFDKTKTQLLLHYYRIIAIVCIGFFFMQEAAFYTTGVRFSGLIPGLSIVSDFGNVSEFVQAQMHGNRSSSFFSEPAHFVQFLLPLLSIELFGGNDKKHRIRALVVVITLLLLQSGNAMLGLTVIGIMFFIKRLAESRSTSTIIGTIITFCSVVIGGGYYLSTEKGQALLAREDQLSLTSYESGQSGFLRIYRGYYVYDNLEPIEKIIGVNDFSTLKERIKTSKVGFMFDASDTYFNAVQDILIRTGVIGLIIFISFLVSVWRGNNYLGKSLVLCLSALCFISAIYMTSTMALFLILSLKSNELIENQI